MSANIDQLSKIAETQGLVTNRDAAAPGGFLKLPDENGEFKVDLESQNDRLELGRTGTFAGPPKEETSVDAESSKKGEDQKLLNIKVQD